MRNAIGIFRPWSCCQKPLTCDEPILIRNQSEDCVDRLCGMGDQRSVSCSGAGSSLAHSSGPCSRLVAWLSGQRQTSSFFMSHQLGDPDTLRSRPFHRSFCDFEPLPPSSSPAMDLSPMSMSQLAFSTSLRAAAQCEDVIGAHTLLSRPR